MLRLILLVCILILPSWAAGKNSIAKQGHAYSKIDIDNIKQSYFLCRKNSGHSDATSEIIFHDMLKIWKKNKYNSNKKEIGKENIPIIVNWLSCVEKYSYAGGEDELDFATNFCNSFSDSVSIRKYIKQMAIKDKEIRDFRMHLLRYATNAGVDCR